MPREGADYDWPRARNEPRPAPAGDQAPDDPRRSPIAAATRPPERDPAEAPDAWRRTRHRRRGRRAGRNHRRTARPQPQGHGYAPYGAYAGAQVFIPPPDFYFQPFPVGAAAAEPALWTPWGLLPASMCYPVPGAGSFPEQARLSQPPSASAPASGFSSSALSSSSASASSSSSSDPSTMLWGCPVCNVAIAWCHDRCYCGTLRPPVPQRTPSPPSLPAPPLPAPASPSPQRPLLAPVPVHPRAPYVDPEVQIDPLESDSDSEGVAPPGVPGSESDSEGLAPPRVPGSEEDSVLRLQVREFEQAPTEALSPGLLRGLAAMGGTPQSSPLEGEAPQRSSFSCSASSSSLGGAGRQQSWEGERSSSSYPSYPSSSYPSSVEGEARQQSDETWLESSARALQPLLRRCSSAEGLLMSGPWASSARASPRLSPRGGSPPSGLRRSASESWQAGAVRQQ